MRASAVARNQKIGLDFGEEAQGGFQTLNRCIQQVQSADDAVYPIDPRNQADIANGVDQPRVAATGQDD